MDPIDPSIIPVLDSHIHLYPTSEIPTLAWCSDDNPLAAQKSPNVYQASVQAAARTDADGKPLPARPFMGAIFVETDRKHDITVSPPDYSGPLAELAWLRRIVEGTPREGEGHGSEHAGTKLLAAIVPWAPMPLGPDALADYLTQAEQAAGRETWKLVRGFRYLLQNKPLGTSVEPAFVDSLKELGKRGYAFDVGIDLNKRGKKQVDEMVDMIEAAHEGVPEGERVKFVLNHLLKPDFKALHPADPAMVSWKSALYLVGKNPSVYMKLSGGFSEMSENLRLGPPSQIFQGIMPWLIAVLASFGPKKIMFGSDWPVCTVGIEAPPSKGEGEKTEEESKENAWGKWRDVAEKICYMATMDKEDQEWVWFRTAMKAYGIPEEK